MINIVSVNYKGDTGEYEITKYTKDVKEPRFRRYNPPMIIMMIIRSADERKNLKIICENSFNQNKNAFI